MKPSRVTKIDAEQDLRESSLTHPSPPRPNLKETVTRASKRFRHKHAYVGHYGGLWADEPGGPRTIHEMWWECSCGKVLDAAAKARAMRGNAE